jgi:glutamate dehydrogenase/leucine dehydrogenase
LIFKVQCIHPGFRMLLNMQRSLYWTLKDKVMAVSYWVGEDDQYTVSHPRGIDRTSWRALRTDGSINQDKAKKAFVIEEAMPGFRDVDVWSCRYRRTINERQLIDLRKSPYHRWGANGPHTLEEDEHSKRGCFHDPDILCNSGGLLYLTSRAFQMIWIITGQQEVLEKLDDNITNAFFSVYVILKRKSVHAREPTW